MQKFAAWGRQLACIFAAVVLLAVQAFALDEAKISDAEQLAGATRAELQDIRSAINSPIVTNDKLSEYRTTLDKLRAGVSAAASSLAEPATELKEQISKLPQAPADGQVETPELSAQRKLLNDINNRLTGAQSQLQILAVEIDQTSGQVLANQRDRFFQQVFEPNSSILSPGLWGAAFEGIGSTASLTARLIAESWRSAPARTLWFQGLLLAAVIALLSLIWRLGLSVWRVRFSQHEAGAVPPNLLRLWRVLWSVVGTGLISWLAVFFVISFMRQTGILTPRLLELVRGLGSFFIQSVTAVVLINRLASPKQPMWRLIPIDDGSARGFAFAGYVCAVLAAASQAFSRIADVIYLPVNNAIAVSAVLSLFMLVSMALATNNLRDRSGSPSAPATRLYYNWARNFRLPVWVALIVAAASLLFGYIALADYVLFRLFATLALVSMLFLIEYTAEAAVQSALDPSTPVGTFVRRATGWSTKAIERGGLIFRTVVDILLLLFGLPALIALWAVNWIDFRALANRVFFSFEIGNVTISPWTVLLVVVLFAAGISLTKLLVRWLDRRILSRAHLERGVQESVRIGASYAGYVFAGAFALSAAGIDFSSLALIAGALGVGIGFGLQSIVNNFVSGIILLAERPVRVGDWIVTSAGEGLVKRINVRSTEIETFDGCSVIVPNSTLITEPVKNWTLGNSIGRVAAAVTVPYTVNAEEVRALLLDILTSHKKVLNFPEPTVTAGKLGTLGVDFELKGMVADVFESVQVASDLRMSILKEFAERDIPVAQPSYVLQSNA